MPTPSFLHLPSDVLLNIGSFLDYSSRMNLNRILIPCERYGIKIPLHARLSHDVITHLPISTHALDKMQTTRGRQRVLHLRQYCRHLLSHKASALLQTFIQFREVILDKMKEFNDSDLLQNAGMTLWETTRLQHQMDEIIKHIHSLPVIHVPSKRAPYTVT